MVGGRGRYCFIMWLVSLFYVANMGLLSDYCYVCFHLCFCNDILHTNDNLAFFKIHLALFKSPFKE